MDIIGLAIIFFASIGVAFTGAAVPGPLLTYTVMQSLSDKKKGYLMGLKIIAGHAILESAIIVVIILGFSALLQYPLFIRIISFAGCGFLVYSGIHILAGLKRGKFSFDLGDAKQNEALPRKLTDHPVVGGIVISMSNPYWWIWWASIGSIFMDQFAVSLDRWDKLLAFFAGHEVGDLVWYVPISMLSFYGKKLMTPSIYKGFIIGCAVFMIGFGLFLAVLPFFGETQ